LYVERATLCGDAPAALLPYPQLLKREQLANAVNLSAKHSKSVTSYAPCQ
jgi:hypothetical protein